MKLRTTVILVFIALVMSLFFLYELWKGTPRDLAQLTRSRIADFTLEDVTGMEMIRDDQRIVVYRDGDRWFIREPLKTRADASVIRSMLTDIEYASRRRTMSQSELRGINISAFGLDPARLIVTVKTRQRTHTLHIGSETPLGDGRYLRVDGSPDILVTDAALFARLDKPLNDLRHRTLLDIHAGDVVRIELKSDPRLIELTRASAMTDAAVWRISRPLAARADQIAVDNLLRDLAALRAQEFVSENSADVRSYNLAEPFAEITLWSRSGESGTTLLLSEPSEKDPTRVYAKVKGVPSIVSVLADDAKKFAPLVNSLRERRLLIFDPDKVTGMELVRGTEKIAIARDETDITQWRITAPIQQPAESKQMCDFIQSLTVLSATEFVDDVATDLGRYGLVAPTATLTLLSTTTNIVGEIVVGALSSDHSLQYVRTLAEPFVYGIAPSLLANWPKHWLDWRRRRIADLTPESISRVEITKPAGRSILEKDAGGLWRLVEPSSGVADTDALRALLSGLTGLRATRFLVENNIESVALGLAEPEMAVTTHAGERVYTLRVGSATADGSKYCSWSQPPLVFTVDLAALTPIVANIATPAPKTGAH